MNFKSKLCVGLSALWASFIFWNSLKTGAVSSASSSGFVTFILDILGKLGLTPSSEVVTVFVRKSAHFAEYLILAILICLIFTLSRKKLKFYTFNVLFLGLGTAVADEFIQTFVSGRTGMVSDVVIDFCGILAGFLLVYVLTRKKRFY